MIDLEKCAINLKNNIENGANNVHEYLIFGEDYVMIIMK